MTFTELIALYAATLSSLLFLWEIYKHFSRGAKIRIAATKDNVLIPDPIEEGKCWIKVTATNTGDQPTTLTGLNFVIIGKGWFKKNISNKAFFIPYNPAGESLPKMLKPGEMWTGVIAQKSDEIDLGNLDGRNRVLIQLSASHRKKPQKRILN